MNKKLILDLDTGIDDALALAYVLASPEVELIGVATSYGNVLLQQGIENTLAFLDMLGHPEIPVYAGLPHPQTAHSYEVSQVVQEIHGENGCANLEIPRSKRQVEKQSAVDFIIEAARQYGSNLLYVPTGPLTNLSAALKKDYEAIASIGGIYDMGGALACEGNERPWAEANIFKDPEAARDCFESGLDIVMVGLDVTHQTLLTLEDTKKWRALNTQAAKVYADMCDFYIKAEMKLAGLEGCGLHDPLTAAVAIDPSLVRCFNTNLTVDVLEPTRGRTIGANNKLTQHPKTCHVALEVETKRFMEEFMNRMMHILAVQ